MRTKAELIEEIQRLDTIKGQFPDHAAIVSEIKTIIISLKYALGDEKIPVPSQHIANFLQRGNLSEGGIWLSS